MPDYTFTKAQCLEKTKELEKDSGFTEAEIKYLTNFYSNPKTPETFTYGLNDIESLVLEHLDGYWAEHPEED